MKCEKCNFMNPEGAIFCCNCGNKMEEMNCCKNPECDNYNKFVIPKESLFCPNCGQRIDINTDAPFHVRHPEYDLVPISGFRYRDDVSFIFNKPEYIEDCYRHEGLNYFLIAKNEKLGVLRYEYHKHWYGDDNFTNRIIPCIYDKIERSENEDFFVCYRGDKKVYIDNKGKLLK